MVGYIATVIWGADLFFPIGVVAKSRTRSDSFICISSKQSKGICLLPSGGGAIRLVHSYKHIILVSSVSHDCCPNLKCTINFLSLCLIVTTASVIY